MNIYPENFRNFPESEKQIWMSFKDWVEEVSSDYEFDNTPYPELYDFKLVSSRKNIAAKKSLQVKADGASFTLLVAKFEIIHEKFSRFNKTSRDIKEEYTHFGGYIELKDKEFGRAFFRPEAVKGSLSVTLTETEISDAISKTHRVFVENEEAFKQKIADSADELAAILKERKLLNIEFSGNAILFSNLKPIDKDGLVAIVNAGLQLDKALNGE